ncbi:MAG: hypothetical protein ABI357_03115, partial [Granulicella sp.]
MVLPFVHDPLADIEYADFFEHVRRSLNICTRRRQFATFATVVMLITCLLSPARAQSTTPATQGLLLTGYFPQWGLYHNPQYLVKNLVTTGDAGMLNQLNYAQGFVTGGHCSIADPNADLDYTFTAEQSVDGIADQPAQMFRGNLHQLMKLKKRYPHLKLLISL